MTSNVQKMLGLANQPVGVWFQDEKPEGAFEFDPAKRPCVVSMLLAASKGRTVVVSDETCPCPGGAVGLGFGNAFARRNTLTHFMLAHGVDTPGFPEGGKMPPHMEHGERFFDCAETTLRWIDEMDLRDAGYRYVVFRPLDIWQGEPPALVWLLADPDQLSALVTMTSYRSGKMVSTVAPFGAGCHSLVQAKHQIGADEPVAIMGMFDVSQRHQIQKDLLSMTFPYEMFERIEADMPEGCATTAPWERLAARRG